MSQEHQRILWIAPNRPKLCFIEALRDSGMEVEFVPLINLAMIPGHTCIVFDHPFSEATDIAECSLRNPDVPIIVLEKSENQSRHLQYLRSGAAVVLFDPADFAVLRETICTVSRFRPVSALQEGLGQEFPKPYQVLFDAAPCFMTVQDRNLKIVASNNKFREAFSSQDNQYCYRVYKNYDEPCPECPILKTFETGRSHQAETVVTTKNGDEIYILVWTSPIRNSHGQITHVMEMSTDITRLRKLQDHVASLGMMLGSMSHGVKGLLMSLDGGMYRLDSGLKKNDPERIMAGWTLVKDRISHIRKMILDILYYSKPRPLEPQIIDVRQLLEDLVRTVEPRAQEAGVNLLLDVQDSCGFFEVDRHALFSALINFLDNAVDACVADTLKTEKNVRVRAERHTGVVTIFIDDNGIGMDQATIDNMFSLFFSSKGVHGTGIGMYVSDYIIGAHNGTIEVVSTLTHGTSCILDIPIRFDGSRVVDGTGIRLMN